MWISAPKYQLCSDIFTPFEPLKNNSWKRCKNSEQSWTFFKILFKNSSLEPKWIFKFPKIIPNSYDFPWKIILAAIIIRNPTKRFKLNTLCTLSQIVIQTWSKCEHFELLWTIFELHWAIFERNPKKVQIYPEFLVVQRRPKYWSKIELFFSNFVWRMIM